MSRVISGRGMVYWVSRLFQKTIRLDHFFIFILFLIALVAIFRARIGFNSFNEKVYRSDIGVADIVQKLRSELGQMEANRISSGQAAILRIKDVDLELGFVIKVDQANKNEIKFEAVTAGSDQSTSLERSNRITLHMEIEPPTWAVLMPSHLSLDQNTTELPDVPLKRDRE